LDDKNGTTKVQNPNINPFDVNLLDTKESILLQGKVSRFNFTEHIPFFPRYVVVTKTALRVYEDKRITLG